MFKLLRISTSHLGTSTRLSNTSQQCCIVQRHERFLSNKGNTMSGMIRDNLVNYGPASNLTHNEKIRTMIAAGERIFHFGFGQSPFPLVDNASEYLKKYVDESAYLPVAGIQELREAICDFHAKHDGLKLDPSNIIVGPGSKELIFLLMNVFGGDIIVISPSWTTYKPQVLLSQHKPHILNTSMSSEWKITAESLEKFLESHELSNYKLLILNNPDNPTGTAYNERDLRSLSDVCRRHNVVILSDEIYGRLKYDHDHVSTAKVYPEGTILCSGLSKWASAGGWRLGYNIFPPELSDLRDAVRSAASHTYTSVAAPIQYALAEVLKQEASCTDYILHTTRIMEAVAQFCHTELTSVGVKAVRPRGGYYIFPDFEIIRDKLSQRGIRTCEEMVNAMFQETSVSVMAGGPAFLRPEDELTTRLCYVNFDGGKALTESRRIGLDTKLADDFVKRHCGPVYDGIKTLTNWVKRQ